MCQPSKNRETTEIAKSFRLAPHSSWRVSLKRAPFT